jgi:hypothetical protein
MNIYEAINNVMADIGAIGKGKKNEKQGFMYRGVDDVMNALQPALIKHKVFIVPEILEQIREQKASSSGGVLLYSICKIKYTFYAEDGSFVTAIVTGEGMDSGDKATNKAMAIAFKYVCFQVFCIPTEEMKDPDKEDPDAPPREKIGEAKIDATKIQTLRSMIKKANTKETELLTHYKVEKIESMTIGTFILAMGALEAMIATHKEKPKEEPII